MALRPSTAGWLAAALAWLPTAVMAGWLTLWLAGSGYVVLPACPPFVYGWLTLSLIPLSRNIDKESLVGVVSVG